MHESSRPVSCLQCPLRGCSGLKAPDPDQLAYLDDFKDGEALVDRGSAVFKQGQDHPHIFTLLSGLAMRFRRLDDGRRQIVNIMFPGDLIGLQAAFETKLSHGVEALLDSRLCIFPRARFVELIGTHPRLGYDIVWMAAKQETELEEHLVSLGQRNARERVASLAVWLIDRGRATGMLTGENELALPLRQAQIADMLGLSLVHTNRTIKALEREGLVFWKPGRVCVPDVDAAAAFGGYERDTNRPRPYI